MRYLTLLTFFLCSCSALTPWSALKSQDMSMKSYGFSTQLPEKWYRLNQSEAFVITQDGLLLNKIVFQKKKMSQKLENTKRAYGEKMTAQELSEIEIDNLSLTPTISDFSILSNQPTTIGSIEAFELVYSYRNKEGLLMDGMFYGFLKGEFVYRIIYESPHQHYFEKSKDSFIQFVENFKLL